MMRLHRIAAIVAAVALSASMAAATLLPECCVCVSNCPTTNTQVCFAEHAGDDCATLCASIGCGLAGSVGDSPCTEVVSCAESGDARCSDGFDNNVNDLIDCADTGCSAAANCAQPAPALGGAGLAGLGAALALIGGWRIARRRS